VTTVKIKGKRNALKCPYTSGISEGSGLEADSQ